MPLRLGTVHLAVRDLERSTGFYQDAIGLRVHGREDGAARLGAGAEDLLVLHEEPDARPAGRHAGLFHVALLHPDRRALARAVLRLTRVRAPLTGVADHGVSEAIYLDDPDGNGLELYADRPRAAWPPPDPGWRVGMFTRPLDVAGLVAAVEGEPPEERADAGLAVGHLHLHVGDLEAARAFYGREAGLEAMAALPGALFLAADGYHHHLGVNTWRGAGVPPAPPGRAGLRAWTLHPGGPAAPRTLHDPWGHEVRIA